MHEFSKTRNILGSSQFPFLFNFPGFMVYCNAEVTAKVFFPFIKSSVADSDELAQGSKKYEYKTSNGSFYPCTNKQNIGLWWKGF